MQGETDTENKLQKLVTPENKKKKVKKSYNVLKY